MRRNFSLALGVLLLAFWLWPGLVVRAQDPPGQGQGGGAQNLQGRVEALEAQVASLQAGLDLLIGVDGHSLDAADGDPVDAVFVDDFGDVGLGTTSPAGKLHVDVPGVRTKALWIDPTFGDVMIGDTTPVNQGLTVGTNARFEKSIFLVGTGGLQMIGGNVILGNGALRLRHLGGNISFENNAGGRIGRITEQAFEFTGTGPHFFLNGNVGIGEEFPGFPLEMGSGAHVTAGGVWTSISSRESKENIRNVTVEEAVAALRALKPMRFNYKVEKEEEYVGFIAEEVPELVATRDRKSLSPMDIVAVLTKVVQEQQKQIEELMSRVNVR